MNKIFILTDEDVERIRTINSQKSIFKELLDAGTLPLETQRLVLDKYVGEAKAYENWFQQKKIEFEFDTTPENTWKVDFGKKELIII